MIEQLPVEIFWVCIGIFGVILGIGLVWKQGVFTMIAGIVLILFMLPVTSIDAKIPDYTNVTSTEIGGNTTITENVIYEEPVEIDYNIKAVVMIFAGLLMMFGWWQGDFENPFGDSV